MCIRDRLRALLYAAEAALALGYIGDMAGICRIDDANRAVLDADAALDAGVSGLGSCGVGSSASGLVRTVARDLRSSELTGIFSSFQLLAQSLAELLGLSPVSYTHLEGYKRQGENR